MYTETLIDAFQNPKNVGEIDNPDILGKAGNPVCGDVMWLYLKFAQSQDDKELMDKIIEDIKFKTMGCAAAIGTSEVICELAKGKTLDEASKITKQDIINYLGSLPPEKVHCSILATEALANGIRDYKETKVYE
jgi:nitrogen fixation NifU-like protein